MKTIKPQKLGVLCKTVDSGDACFFTVAVLALFTYHRDASGRSAPSPLLSEVDLWKLCAAELGSEPVDMVMPKLRGELLVSGAAFPQGGPQSYCTPRIALGPIEKSICVVGDRIWSGTAATDPVPFTEMPIRYERAFGGAGYHLNPTGIGLTALRSEDGDYHPLPNVEDLDNLVRAPEDRPPPAGFGPLDITWAQRAAKAGTYDAAWQQERFPGFAIDMDWAIFNAAPEDQQIEGFFRGDEAFTLELLHPERPRIEAALPGIKARTFVTQSSEGGDVFREIEMRLDTVRLFPRSERGIVIFHGAIEVAEDDAADIVHLVLGCEGLAETKPAEHYRDVLARRLDRKKGHLLVLKDSELMPSQKATIVSAEEAAERAVFATEGLLRKNLRRRMEAEREQAKQRAAALGLDPEKIELPPLPPEEPPLDDMEAFIEKSAAGAEAEKDAAEEQRAESEKKAREQCAAQGLDYDKIMEEARSGSGGPPKFSAEQELGRLRDAAHHARARGIASPELDAILADPSFAEKLHATERQLREAYRKLAHQLPAAPALDENGRAKLRRELTAGIASGRSFAGADLTGADLSEMSLARVDLSGAMLEGANLADADLRGADLTGVVLTRANLTRANLTSAKLGGANLGHARLNDAELGGADLSAAVLVQADLSGANFRDALLSRADLSEATFAGADLTRVKAGEASFIKADLSGSRLCGADLSKSNFIESNLGGVDFTGAKLVSAVLLTARADGAIFREADLDNLRVVHDSSLEGADFQGARLDSANLRGTLLSRSNFSGARLHHADLSECDLRGAVLTRADARAARFVRADLTAATMRSINLLEGSLAKAELSGADLRGANLYRADLSHARVDAATNFEDANVKRVRVVAPRRRGERPASWPLPSAHKPPTPLRGRRAS